jgi:hypothetical protein
LVLPSPPHAIGGRLFPAMLAAPSEAGPTSLGAVSDQGGLVLQRTTAPGRPVLGAGPANHLGLYAGLRTLGLR